MTIVSILGPQLSTLSGNFSCALGNIRGHSVNLFHFLKIKATCVLSACFIITYMRVTEKILWTDTRADLEVWSNHPK